MNTNKLNSPMFGAFTDMHVWNKQVSYEEENMWTNCLQSTVGDILNWQNFSQQIKLIGLEEIDVPFDNICPKRFEHLFVTNYSLNFHETLNLCEKLGEMTEISSNETAYEFNKTLERDGLPRSVCGGLPGVLTGYTDIKDEGDWVLFNTNKKMMWNNWAPGENAYNKDNEDCGGFNRHNMHLYDVSCSTKYEHTVCPVCNIAPVKFLFSQLLV